MAEARAATAEPLPPLHLGDAIDPSTHKVQARYSDDGLSLFVPHPRFIIREAGRFLRRSYRKLSEAFIPVPFPVIFGMQFGACVWLLTSKSTSWIRQSRLANFLWNLDSKYNPFAPRLSTQARVGYQTAIFSFAVMSSFAVFHRSLLRVLLSYTGWMTESRGPASLKTKVWGFVLKYIYMKRPSGLMLAYQGVLPHQPLPTVQDTVQRYLASMEPILGESEFLELKASAETFVKRDSGRLQRLLQLKRMFTSNYMSDWWLNYVYLRGRDSLLINSNFYGQGMYVPPPTKDCAARAAVFTYLMVLQKVELDREMVPPALVQGTVPMCMDQYTRAYSLCREPHQEQDKLVQYDATQSRHVVVMFRGRFFKVKVFDEVNGKRLSMYQLYDAYRRIVQSVREDQPAAAEAKLAALTADNRNTWAQVRTDLLQRNPTNRASLEAIERALFMVTIIDTDLQYTDITPLSNMYIAHDGKTYWCDKSFTVVITTGGLMALHAEHSWADAPVMCHLVEQATGREANDEKSIYAADGSVLPTAEEAAALATGRLRTVAPERLQWYVTDALRDAMDGAFERITASIKDLDLVSNRFTDFGKGKIKKTKCSPDAFVQMALQLAYYRDQGEFTQTYESSMLRLYLEGRTETIRSATYQSCAWVKSMLDSTTSTADRAKLLREACATHQRNTALCMTGKGVDRHLFALYVVAVGTMTDSPFLTTMLRRGWKLSTSQTPVGLGTSWKSKNHLDTHPRTLGGFGPVRDDGYGVAYAISNENLIVFHVSSKRSCPTTDSTRLYGQIYKAMHEMAALFETEPAKPAVAAVIAPAPATVTVSA